VAASWADLIAGVAANLQTVSDSLKVVDYYSDSLTIPVGGLAEIGPATGEGTLNSERARDNGVWVYSITVSLYLSTASEQTAQSRMLAYMSVGNDLSVWHALEPADFTLGALAGIAQKAIVTRSHSYGNIERSGGGRLLTNSWDVNVWAAGES
jgi:hypothetical protein